MPTFVDLIIVSPTRQFVSYDICFATSSFITPRIGVSASRNCEGSRHSLWIYEEGCREYVGECERDEPPRNLEAGKRSWHLLWNYVSPDYGYHGFK